MISHLPLRLSSGAVIAIQNCGGCDGFGRFAELLGGAAIPGRAVAPVVELSLRASDLVERVIYASPRGNLKVALTDDDGSFEVAVAPGGLDDATRQMRAWHYSMLCAGIGAVLRGIPAILVHGAALMKGDSALLLCGESGIGKSTTAKRWEKLGRKFAADDMFLLEYGREGGFFAHALPTWSRCMKAPEEPRFPVDAALPVAGILGLSRSTRGDVVEPVSKADFLGQILRSMSFHTKGIVKLLPRESQLIFGRRLAEAAGCVADRFPACGLFADLNGDLAAALDGYCSD